MKIFLKFEFQKNEIPKNYRSFLLSYFKHTLEKFNKELYDKYYSEKYSIKNFCFCTYIKNAVFSTEQITFDEDILVTISVNDFSDGIDWYNAFLKMKNKEFVLPNSNIMKLKSIKIENHKEIITNSITIKMLSPIVVRKVTNAKNHYYSFQEDEFCSMLKENIVSMLETFTGIPKDNIPMTIMAIAPKKTVTYAFGTNITANLGIYRIESDPEFLNYLYQLGIGSRRSEGFGMFEII